jgi:hypothetical protein
MEYMTQLQGAECIVWNRRHVKIEEYQVDAIRQRMHLELLRRKIDIYEPFMKILRAVLGLMEIPNKPDPNALPY